MRFSGLGDAFQILEKLFAGVYSNHVQTQTLIIVHHIPELVFTEQTVVHEDTCQVFADGAIQQHGSHRRIHTAAKPLR